MRNKLLEIVKGPEGPIILATFLNGIITCYVSILLGIISAIITGLCMYRCLKIGFKDGKESKQEIN